MDTIQAGIKEARQRGKTMNLHNSFWKLLPVKSKMSPLELARAVNDYGQTRTAATDISGHEGHTLSANAGWENGDTVSGQHGVAVSCSCHETWFFTQTEILSLTSSLLRLT